MRKALGLLAVLALPACPAWAWGPKAHKVIAELARGSMLSAKARSAIVRILGDDDLPAVSTWADDIRPNNDLADTEEARELLRRFPRHAEWHYIAIPLGAATAEHVAKYRKSDDVASAISRMTSVLEAPEKPEAGITHRQALMWLVHLVADAHCPVHAGTCYYAPVAGGFRVVTDPNGTLGAFAGEGGDEIELGGRQRFHGLWDSPMVDAVLPGAGKPGLSAYLARTSPTQPVAPIDPKSEPQIRWLLESAGVARLAYGGVHATSIVRDGRRMRVTAQLAAGYAETNRDRAETQLLRAGQRLAGLLNGIRWPEHTTN